MEQLFIYTESRPMVELQQSNEVSNWCVLTSLKRTYKGMHYKTFSNEVTWFGASNVRIMFLSCHYMGADIP